MEYHRVLAGEHRRIARGVLAILLLLGGMFVLAALLLRAAAVVEARLGNTTAGLGSTDHTRCTMPPACAGPPDPLERAHPADAPRRPPRLHSVLSRSRFDLLGRTLVLVVPLWVVAMVVQNLLHPGPTTERSYADAVAALAVTVLLVPLQAAGEECAAWWSGSPAAGPAGAGPGWSSGCWCPASSSRSATAPPTPG